MEYFFFEQLAISVIVCLSGHYRHVHPSSYTYNTFSNILEKDNPCKAQEPLHYCISLYSNLKWFLVVLWAMNQEDTSFFTHTHLCINGRVEITPIKTPVMKRGKEQRNVNTASWEGRVMFFWGMKWDVAGGKKEEVGRRRSLAYNEHTIIWGIRDSTWQDKSNQNAETIEAERMKKRQAIPVLLRLSALVTLHSLTEVMQETSPVPQYEADLRISINSFNTRRE